MRKFYCFFVLFTLVVYTVCSVDVVENELSAVAGKDIVFENYTGTYTETDSPAEVRAIGKALADGLKRSGGKQFNYHLKYSIIHAYQGDDKLFGADVFVIDRASNIDHIRNIRAIISAYLSAAYGYSVKDANLLARFITIYNAVYRKDVNYFKTKYSDVVMKNVDGNNAGLALKYSEWPGNTRIIIPLTDKNGRGVLSSLDTGELSGGKVKETLKKSDDKGIADRKELVNLKEREVKQQQKELDKDKKEIAKKESVIQKNQEKITKKESELDKKQASLDEKKKEAAKIDDPAQKEKQLNEIAKVEEKLKAEKDKLEAEKDKLDAEKKTVEDEKQKTSESEKTIQTKTDEINKDKEEIKQDQNELNIEKNPQAEKEKIIEQQKQLENKEKTLEEKEAKLEKVEQQLKDNKTDPKIIGANFYYLKVKEYLNDGHYNNEMLVIDAVSRTIKVSSPFKDICGKEYLVFNEGVVVIGHKGKHEAEHFLTILDKDTLELRFQGSENIFFRSFVEQREGSIYAVLKRNNDFYLGKFNTKMELVAASQEKIDKDSFITFFDGNIYLNGEYKNILILKGDDLTKIESINP